MTYEPQPLDRFQAGPSIKNTIYTKKETALTKVRLPIKGILDGPADSEFVMIAGQFSANELIHFSAISEAILANYDALACCVPIRFWNCVSSRNYVSAPNHHLVYLDICLNNPNGTVSHESMLSTELWRGLGRIKENRPVRSPAEKGSYGYYVSQNSFARLQFELKNPLSQLALKIDAILRRSAVPFFVKVETNRWSYWGAVSGLTYHVSDSKEFQNVLVKIDFFSEPTVLELETLRLKLSELTKIANRSAPALPVSPAPPPPERV